MKTPILIAACLVSLTALAQSGGGTLNKCRTADGKFTYQDRPCATDTTAVSSKAMKASPSSQRAFVVDQENNAYRTLGAINGSSTKFLIDTGATSVAIPAKLASLAQLPCLRRNSGLTAGGVTQTCDTVIKELSFGPFVLTNVPAAILPNLHEPLLGINVLQNFHIEHQQGQMRITLK